VGSSSISSLNSPVTCRLRRSRQGHLPAFFFRSPLANLLVEKQVGTVVVSGVQTDVCVLSTVLNAVNLGFRVVIVEDALSSSSDAGRDAPMTMYRLRFTEQINLVTAAQLPDLWRPE
jgi:nicotinamidase-related amidase